MSEKVELPVKELLPILNFAKTFVADTDIVPDLMSFLFRAGTLRAYDGKAGVIYVLPWKMPRDFSTPAAPFVRTIASLHEQGTESVTLSFAETRLTLKGGRFTATLALQDGERDQLLIEPPAQGAKGVVEGDVDELFWTGVERLMFTIGKDSTRSYLKGVYWSEAGELMSSDGFRISRISAGVGIPKCPMKDGVLLPDTLLVPLGPKRKDIVRILIKEGMMWLVMPTGFIFGSMYADAFPGERAGKMLNDLRLTIKSKKGTWIALDPDAPFDLILNRLVEFTPRNQPIVECVPKGKTLVLRAHGEDGAPEAGEDIITAEISGAEVEKFMCSGIHLREALKVGTRIWHSAKNAPLYFVSSDKRFEHLIRVVVQ